MTASETLVARSALWATTGAAAAVPVLFLPAPQDPLLSAVIHLALVALFGLGLTVHLAPLVEPPWFADIGVGVGGRRALSWLVLAATVAAAVTPVMLATAVAMRYDASLQFFLVLAAQGVGWIGATVAVGGRRRFGARSGTPLAGMIVAVCVWAAWRYLDTVGFTPAGGWVVDGSEMLRLVIPYVLGGTLLGLLLVSAGARYDP